MQPLVGEPSYVARQRIGADLAAVDSEIESIQSDIQQLTAVLDQLHGKRRDILKNLEAVTGNAVRQDLAKHASPNTTPGRTAAIDYFQQFEWTAALKASMKRVFAISGFRLCQEGVCNANMDGRDIVCVMPTGGGKSLTYQLPALLNPGCTLVISPLVSLIMDQVAHLEEAGIEAVRLTGATSKEEVQSIMTRLNPNTSKTAEGNASKKEIKLCYVTPEKISKSKTFVSLMEKMYKANKLARIVIDEAHCVSQLGHDFRPDYKKLNMLRQLFPKTPIMALSATCPPKVLQDLLKTLRLQEVTFGNAASRLGTVYFTAPLYRKNLHYAILTKPSSTQATIEAMSEYILRNHPGDSGIVYCLSKKDAEVVAEGLQDVSSDKIKTGVYHADCPALEKEELHKNWRAGRVKVVCATIAFGLGIDKGDVRFVIHHSISKSLDGFYQESGRAGRDGLDADCILYYRSQDISRLSALVCGEAEGQEKLHSMVAFAQNLTECRKILFANYFSSSSSIALSSWTADSTDSITRCGHCDNCTRRPEDTEMKSIGLEVWQILRVVQAVDADNGRVTIGILTDLVRGVGSASFTVSGPSSGKKRKAASKDKLSINMDVIAGGKVTMNKDDVEFIIVKLLLEGYLNEEYSATAYAINVYLRLGPNAIRVTRHSRDAIVDGKGPRIEIVLPKKGSKRKAVKKADTEPKKMSARPEQSQLEPTLSASSKRRDSQTRRGAASVDSLSVARKSIIELSDDSELDTSPAALFDTSKIGDGEEVSRLASDVSDEDSDADFTFTMDGRPPPKRKRASSFMNREVIDLSP